MKIERWRSGRYAALAVSAALLLGACDSQTKTFGSSYDECVLQNATKGGDETSRSIATDICRRRFERAPTAKEEEHFLAEVIMQFDSQDVLYPSKTTDEMSATIWNEHEKLVISKVTVTVDFYKAAPPPGGRSPNDRPIDSAVWDRVVNIYPSTSETIIGTFGEGERAPSRFYSGTFVVKKVLPREK